MADDYWDHPSRREIKRLIDLGDAGAILDELQQGSTEWDDAREALDHLVRGSRPEVERLCAEHVRQIEAERDETREDELEKELADARAERARAVEALGDIGRAAEEAGGNLEDGINAELLAARSTNEQLRAALAKRPKSRLGEQVTRLSNAVGDLERERDDARTERDAAREQVKRVEKLRDRWEAAVRDPTIYRNGGIEHAAALAASHLPDLRRALGGTEPGQ